VTIRTLEELPIRFSMGRIFALALFVAAGVLLWNIHPFGIGAAMAAEHELKANLTNHAEHFGTAKPTEVSCEEFGTIVRPPVLGGYGLSGERVERDEPDSTIFNCNVDYEDNHEEMWCFSNSSVGLIAPMPCDSLRRGDIVRKS
jgi:hypothetical protein